MAVLLPKGISNYVARLLHQSAPNFDPLALVLVAFRPSFSFPLLPVRAGRNLDPLPVNDSSLPELLRFVVVVDSKLGEENLVLV